MRHPCILPALLGWFWLTSLSVMEAKAQATDTANHYIHTFPDQLTSRLYLSRKYTALGIHDLAENRSYRYLPNTSLNLGLGATYNWLTLNAAFGFGFLNPDLGRGNTRNLDLQAHAYPKKFVIDLFGQFYKGFYLGTEGRASPPQESYYVRPDLVVTKLGFSGQHLFNHERFSYRAAFLQNEWQKKSAGSFLLGFELYGGRALGDSALAPTNLLMNPDRNFRTARFFEGGPSGGYAYTLVIKKHFFLTASVTTSLAVGYSKLEGEAIQNTHWGLRPNLFLRGFAGYNSERWSVNFNYVRNHVRLVQNTDFATNFLTGNYRVNLVYRFNPGERALRWLRKTEKVGDFLGL